MQCSPLQRWRGPFKALAVPWPFVSGRPGGGGVPWTLSVYLTRKKVLCHLKLLLERAAALADGGAGAWSVLRILFVIDDLSVVLGGWRCWRFGVDDPLAVPGAWRRWCVERPQSSFGNRRPSRGFVERLEKSASLSTALSWFWVVLGAGAWSVSDFGRAAALARGAY